jgi:hypothetical protein
MQASCGAVPFLLLDRRLRSSATKARALCVPIWRLSSTRATAQRCDVPIWPLPATARIQFVCSRLLKVCASVIAKCSTFEADSASISPARLCLALVRNPRRFVRHGCSAGQFIRVCSSPKPPHTPTIFAPGRLPCIRPARSRSTPDLHLEPAATDLDLFISLPQHARAASVIAE